MGAEPVQHMVRATVDIHLHKSSIKPISHRAQKSVHSRSRTLFQKPASIDFTSTDKHKNGLSGLSHVLGQAVSLNENATSFLLQSINFRNSRAANRRKKYTMNVG